MTEGRSIGEVLTVLKDEFPDITISKIRFLESQGLLQPDRTASGYRQFGPGDVDQLRWILTEQRDNFLPLKVIREKLEAGEAPLSTNGVAPDDVEADDESEAHQDPPLAPAAAAPSRRAPAGRGGPERAAELPERLSRDELMRAAGLSHDQMTLLERFGLVAGREDEGGKPYCAIDAHVAEAAARLFEHGFEARHLRAYKVAAEREAGLFEQRIAPLPRARAGEVLEELVELGHELRTALLHQLLAAHFTESTG